MDADEFDRWMLWDQWFPLDDQRNIHMPFASLQATVQNKMRGEGVAAVSLYDCLLFKGAKPPIEEIEIGESPAW